MGWGPNIQILFDWVCGVLIKYEKGDETSVAAAEVTEHAGVAGFIERIR